MVHVHAGADQEDGHSDFIVCLTQRLARHSAVEMTIIRDTHAGMDDLASAIHWLPTLPTIDADSPEAGFWVARLVARSVEKTGFVVMTADETVKPIPTGRQSTKPLKFRGFEGDCESLTSGEGGIRFRRYPQRQVASGDSLQPIWPLWIASRSLVRVICGCWVMFGIASSTLSAHSADRRKASPPALPPSAGGSSRQCSSQRSRRGRTGGDDATKSGASHARYSSDLQDEKSITDQQRMCREQAVRDGLLIEPSFEFADNAVSGTKLRRVGLDRLLVDAKQRNFPVLYFHSLSRLARESVITMPMLKELVYVHRVRFISITEGIDSNQPGWEIHARFTSLHHEQYIKDLSANVHRGQVGTVLARFSIGDYRLGYTSVPSPGGEMIGRGRNAKPRMVYAIDPVTAEWVRRIFHWFVGERRSIGWIVRELNRLKAPKDQRASTTTWQHQLVARALRSATYIGLWSWGRLKNHRNPLTGQVTQEERDEEESDQWLREFPELRIIDEDTFSIAQRLLDENDQRCGEFRSRGGRLCGSPSGNGREHLLSAIVQCGRCGRKLHVGGAHGKYLYCSGNRQGLCECTTQLPRARAEKQILAAIGERILSNPHWCEAVYAAMDRAWHERITSCPNEVRELEAQIKECERRIERLVTLMESSDDPDPDLLKRLAERRTERNHLARQERRLQSETASTPTPPTREWADQQLTQLGEVLRSSTPAAGMPLRDLLNGPIVVEEVIVPGKKRRYWRGKLVFVLDRVAGVQTTQPLNDSTESECALTETVVIDFREESRAEQLAERAWELYEQGLMYVEIAEQLGINQMYVTKVVRTAAKQRGIESLDGRHRQAAHDRRRAPPPPCRALQAEAIELWNEEVLLGEIAVRLHVSRNLLNRMIAAWHVERGLPVPDGRKRRKDLLAKQRSDSNEAPPTCDEAGTATIESSKPRIPRSETRKQRIRRAICIPTGSQHWLQKRSHSVVALIARPLCERLRSSNLSAGLSRRATHRRVQCVKRGLNRSLPTIYVY